MKTLELRPVSLEALCAELRDNLLKGRAFVAGASGLGKREACVLVIVHPEHGRRLSLQAEAVWIGPSGVGVEVSYLTETVKRELENFVSTPDSELEGESAGDAEARRLARHVQERVRALSLRERDEMARRGSLSERVALERAYGSSVWEALLQNPQLTPPEVARVAKNGTLPRPLVGVIVSNQGFIAHGEVQRALLSNPRCSGPSLERVLRAMKPKDLARLAQQCPYRAEVRTTAQRLARK